MTRALAVYRLLYSETPGVEPADLDRTLRAADESPRGVIRAAAEIAAVLMAHQRGDAAEIADEVADLLEGLELFVP